MMIKNRQVIFYETDSGKCPLAEWLDKLDTSVQAKINRRLDRIEEGNLGNSEPIVKSSGISEFKFYFGPGYRIYYGLDGECIIILLCGGDKKSQSRDVKIARNYWADYKTRIK